MNMASRIQIAIAVAIALAPLPVFAALGGDASTVNADQAQLQASAIPLTASVRNAEMLAASSMVAANPSTLPGSVTVQELTQPDGTVIREYLSNGQVFGIAWTGPTPPNLRQLLGEYFQTYASNVQTAMVQSPNHGPGLIQTPGLVVYSGGHMNFFSGQAYLPQLLPQGVTANDIQ